jgi:hypothetical protein
VLRRKSPKRLAFRNLDRLIFTSLYRLAPRVVNAVVIVQPKTVIIALSGATQRQDGAVSLPDRIKRASRLKNSRQASWTRTSFARSEPNPACPRGGETRTAAPMLS